MGVNMGLVGVMCVDWTSWGGVLVLRLGLRTISHKADVLKAVLRPITTLLILNRAIVCHSTYEVRKKQRFCLTFFLGLQLVLSSQEYLWVVVNPLEGHGKWLSCGSKHYKRIIHGDSSDLFQQAFQAAIVG